MILKSTCWDNEIHKYRLALLIHMYCFRRLLPFSTFLFMSVLIRGLDFKGIYLYWALCKYSEIKFSSGSRIKPGFTAVEKSNLSFLLNIKGKCLTYYISKKELTSPFPKNLGERSLFLQSLEKNLSLGNRKGGIRCKNEKSFSVETKQTGAGLSKIICVYQLLWANEVL